MPNSLVVHLRIVAVSDIHLDINTKRKDPEFGGKLVQYLKKIQGDILILAGDIAGNTKILIDFLSRTKELNFKYKYYVPGNHDVWVNQDATNLSYIKYYEILPEIVPQFNWEFIPNNPVVIDDIAIIGTMGWYDYSTRNRIWDNVYTIEDYETKSHPNSNVDLMDRYYVNFGKTDREMSKQLISELEDDFDYIERRYDIASLRATIVITHMVPFKQFIPYRGVFKYDYFTAFFGNLNLGKFLQKKSLKHNIHAIFGQTHIPKIQRLDPNLKGYCVPIGYPREYGREINLENLFQSRVITIDL